jgi:Tol biopolymer transport system component
MIDVDGGAPRRLTAEAGYQVVPTWSHEGRWIYYSSWQADTRDIWRVPADGGGTQDADSPLMTMALPSGQARQLIACVKNSAFGVGPRGVYYVPCDQSPDPPVYLLDPRTGRNARLGTLDGLWPAPWASVCRPTAIQSCTPGRCSHVLT